MWRTGSGTRLPAHKYRQPQSGRVGQEQRVPPVFDLLEGKLERLNLRIALQEWRLYAGRTEITPLRWQVEKNRLLGRSEVLEQLRYGSIASNDPLVSRRVELLRRCAEEAALEHHPSVAGRRTRLENRWTKRSSIWKGKRVGPGRLRRILQASPDREERRKAFDATQASEEPLERPLLDIVRLRNDRARSLGYRDLPEFRLRCEGFSETAFRAFTEDLLSAVRPAIRALRDHFQDVTGERGWYPWDLLAARASGGKLPLPPFDARDLVPAMLRAFQELGFSESDLAVRFGRHRTENAGITIPVDPPNDVRILTNFRPGWVAYDVAFHEFGHAVHERSVRQPSHLLRWEGYVPGLQGMVEGIGCLFEYIASAPRWLSTRPRLSKKERAGFLALLPAGQGVSVALSLVAVLAELDHYRHPNRDPRRTHAKLLREILELDAFPPYPSVNWFEIAVPTYSLVYLFARVWAAQVREAMLEECGGPLWPNVKVGPWMKENWFQHGARYDWRERVREVTGRPFSPQAFRRELKDASVD